MKKTQIFLLTIFIFFILIQTATAEVNVEKEKKFVTYTSLPFGGEVEVTNNQDIDDNKDEIKPNSDVFTTIALFSLIAVILSNMIYTKWYNKRKTNREILTKK